MSGIAGMMNLDGSPGDGVPLSSAATVGSGSSISLDVNSRHGSNAQRPTPSDVLIARISSTYPGSDAIDTRYAWSAA